MWGRRHARDDRVYNETGLRKENSVHSIIVKQVIRAAKVVSGRIVAGKTVMRVVAHVINSDLITHVSESFVNPKAVVWRSHEWPDLGAPPEKLSEIHYVENEILQSITDVVESPEDIYVKICVAQSAGMTVTGSATQSIPGTTVG